MSEIVQSERHGAVALLRLNRPEALNALSDEVLEALCAALDARRGVGGACAASCSAAPGGRSPPAPTSRACASSRPSDVLAGERGARWERLRASRAAGDRGRARLVPRRRLRARADLRHRARGRGCALRPARDGPRADPGRGRDAAAAAHRGPLARARDDPRRPHADGARGAAGRHLLARGGAARRSSARRSRSPRASPQRPGAGRAPGARGGASSRSSTPLETGLGEERRLFALAFASDDAREGMDAFVERRAPVWSHGS